jgi:hypothetical protein
MALTSKWYITPIVVLKLSRVSHMSSRLLTQSTTAADRIVSDGTADVVDVVYVNIVT